MRSILEKALIALLNEEKDKASELFDQFMVTKSKQINESNIDDLDTTSVGGDEGLLNDIKFDFEHTDVAKLVANYGSEFKSLLARRYQATDITHSSEDWNGEDFQSGSFVVDGSTFYYCFSEEMNLTLHFALTPYDKNMFESEEVDSVVEPLALTDDSIDDDEEETIEDRVSDLESELNRLASEFNELMGDEVDTEMESDDNTPTFESVDESQIIVQIPKGDGRLQGDIKFKQNKVSPVLNVPFDKRSSTAKPVINKSVDKSGFDKEPSPAVKPIMKAKKVSQTKVEK